MPNHRNVVGNTFGNLEVLEEIRVPYIGSEKNRKTTLKLKCRCKCGNMCFPFKNNVLMGKSTGCPNCNNSKDLFGLKFGSLLVIKRDENRKKKWICKCDCENEYSATVYMLRNAKDKRCDRCRFVKKFRPKISKKEAIENLKHFQVLKHEDSKLRKIGSRIGRLRIVEFSHWKYVKGRRRAYYKCKCKCGNIVETRGEVNTRSCGCLQKCSVLKGEHNGNSKLTNKEVVAIREFAQSNMGYTGRELAKIFQVTESVISNILRRETYRTSE